MNHVTISKIHIMQHDIQKSIDTQTSNCEYYKRNMKCIVQIQFNGIVMKCMFTRDYCIFCTIPVFTNYTLYNLWIAFFIHYRLHVFTFYYIYFFCLHRKLVYF